MNYELALKLKKAGFPNLGNGKGDNYIAPEESELGISRSEICYSPTIEEIIDACGIHFEFLKKIDEDYYEAWQGITWEGEFDSGVYLMGSGKTPKEAVANLWLEINK